MAVAVSVVIITFNEGANIAQALRSVCGWAREVWVVDSYSTDQTLEIANSFPCGVVQHRFEGYPEQRNWALDNLPIRSHWVFFLDADEWLPGDLKAEISGVIGSNPRENGFYVRRRFVWMGKWIRRGYYPTWLMRLFRRGKGRYESRSLNEHPLVEPPLGYLKHDFIHEDRRDLSHWIEKHNRYTTREAEELFNGAGERQLPASFWGSQPERKRWLRYKVYNRLPPLVRPFLYFGYRYLVRGGFLDGKEAFLYHFLQGLWFPLLIDAKYLEMKWQKSRTEGLPVAAGSSATARVGDR
jgi:glycosyltransferase involved in cell wall biosynthesis